MVKRRRGARSARSRSRHHRPFEELVAVALDAIPEPFASALDEVAVVIADDPTPDQRRENEIGPDETLYGLYEGVPRTEWGADWVADPEPYHALPPAARGGFRGPGRPRRRGLGDGHPRARPSPRHRRRPAAASSASTDTSVRQPSEDRRSSRRGRPAADEPDPHRDRVSQRNRRLPGHRRRWIAIAARTDVVETDRRAGQPDEHDDLRRDRDRERGVDERPEREDADDDADGDAGRARPARSPGRARARRTRAARCPARRPARANDQQDAPTVSNTATSAAASLRAPKTRNDRRVASIGSTSPSTIPVSR